MLVCACHLTLVSLLTVTLFDSVLRLPCASRTRRGNCSPGGALDRHLGLDGGGAEPRSFEPSWDIPVSPARGILRWRRRTSFLAEVHSFGSPFGPSSLLRRARNGSKGELAAVRGIRRGNYGMATLYGFAVCLSLVLVTTLPIIWNEGCRSLVWSSVSPTAWGFSRRI